MQGLRSGALPSLTLPAIDVAQSKSDRDRYDLLRTRDVLMEHMVKLPNGAERAHDATSVPSVTKYASTAIMENWLMQHEPFTNVDTLLSQ